MVKVMHGSLTAVVVRGEKHPQRVRIVLVICFVLLASLFGDVPIKAESPAVIDGPQKRPEDFPADYYGELDEATPTWDGIWVTGWAVVPTRTTQPAVHIYLDDRLSEVTWTSNAREDVRNAYPDIGLDVGFAVSVPAPVGEHTICAYADHSNVDESYLLGCRDVTMTGDPMGSFDRLVAAPGGIQVGGWVTDTGLGATEVHAYLDGVGAGLDMANQKHPGVTRADYRNSPENRGFNFRFPASPGNHEVCVYGINRGEGSNSLIGCRSISLNGVPFGQIDGAYSMAKGSSTPGGEVYSVRITGWFVDPYESDDKVLRVFVDGKDAGPMTVDVIRRDVVGQYGYYGNNVGFDAWIPVTAGRHQICVYDDVTSLWTQTNSLIGCSIADVITEPIGVLDAAIGVDGPEGTGVRVMGWAIQPDVVDPIEIQINVQDIKIVLANLNRPDVAESYPLYGPLHGFDVFIPTTAGQTFTVCVFTRKRHTESQNLLDCKSVAVGIHPSTPSPVAFP